MQLILESGKTVQNPSDEEIARYLPAEEFAILSASPESSTYLQVGERKEPPWDLIMEYQVGSLDNHFRAANTPLTMEAVITAFQKYAKGDESWKSDLQWERMELKRSFAMTASGWLEFTDPIPMLEFLRDHQMASSRKLRLFSVACCHRIWPFLTERSRKFVELAECFADSTVTTEDMNRATNKRGGTGFASQFVRAGAKVSNWYAARAVGFAIVPSVDPETDNVAWAAAAAVAIDGIDWNDPLWDTTMRTAYTSGGYEIEDEEHWAEVWDQAAFAISHNFFTSFPGWDAERNGQAAIVRDIFHSPFHLVSLDPIWLTPQVLTLAQEIYDHRTFEQLLELADALEEAGCDQEVILSHCREPGPHVRGCWVLDAVLGKE